MYQFKMPSNLVQRGQPVPQFPGMQSMPQAGAPASGMSAMAAAPQASNLDDMMAYYGPRPAPPQAPQAPSLGSIGPMGINMPQQYGGMPQPSGGPSFFTL